MSQIWLKFGLMNFKDFIKSSNFLKIWCDKIKKYSGNNYNQK